jgi:hypothetical protein
MASERKVAANRRNASKSTGPRSETGKKRVSANALRHGLCSIQSRSLIEEGVEALARRIVGKANDEVTLLQGRIAAEAQINLDRVRRAKLTLITLEEAAPLTEAMARVLPKIAKLDRYEARAVAQRDRAIRTLLEIAAEPKISTTER